MGRLKAPFPWFGGKSLVSDLAWKRFGKVYNYVEPFFGSGAVLLGSPRIHRTETINDIDGYVSNFWRSIKSDPEQVAHYADWPVNENDLHARHAWLVGQRDDLVQCLEGDPEYFDAKIAGWWVWGICCWIGGEFCSGKGPWRSIDGRLVKTSSMGIERKRPAVGNSGVGVNRQSIQLGNYGQVVTKRRPHIFRDRGVILGSSGVYEWFKHLSRRLSMVRVCSGDWSRVLGPTPTTKLGLTAVFLDPPYGEDANRKKNLYSNDSLTVACDVAQWAIEHGEDGMMRIALCGYDGEHSMPSDWDCVPWKSHGFQQGDHGRNNATKERIWFSPHCESGEQLSILEIIK